MDGSSAPAPQALPQVLPQVLPTPGPTLDVTTAKDAAPAPDRRSGTRLRTVYRVVKVIRDGHVGLWRIRNISDDGMMLATAEAVEISETLRVELSETCSLAGRVVWTAPGHCGVMLDAPVDSAALLRDLAEAQRNHSYRPPRISVVMPGVAYSEKGMHAVHTTDLSQFGIGFTHGGQFEPGMRVLMLLDNGLERRGTVRWTDGQRAGLSLAEPLACSELSFCIEG